ncbi:MAG: hypothetical protein E6G85_14155 [Alphaproteobacteria bacterium]|nr:MAG: hypothetical protein E6G85_14155 [Alphaproteobacteria bacterium]
MRGIQYAAASRIGLDVPGILDRPVKPDDDSGVWRAFVGFNFQTSRRTSPPSRSADSARALQDNVPRKIEGAGKAGCSASTRSLARKQKSARA